MASPKETSPLTSSLAMIDINQSSQTSRENRESAPSPRSRGFSFYLLKNTSAYNLAYAKL